MSSNHCVFKGYREFPKDFGSTVVAIGNFDGVHIGHQAIFNQALALSKKKNAKFVIYTFRPHPAEVLRPMQAPTLLTTYDEKIELLEQQGCDGIIEEPFDLEYSKLSPTDFVETILIQTLKAQEIIVGFNFAFGKDRSGGLEILKSICQTHHVTLHVIPAFQKKGFIVSSSLIRDQLKSKNVEAAQFFLNRPFSYEGTVVRGEGRGKKLGFPTANLKIKPKLMLPNGVYLTQANQKISVTNIGFRPTFYSSNAAQQQTIETHILDIKNTEFYGEKIKLEFLKFIRDEKKFNNVEELKAQIFNDIHFARSAMT